MESLTKGAPAGYPSASASLAAPLGAAVPRAAGPGLVSSETSDTRSGERARALEENPEGITVYRHDARLKRMQRSVRTAAELHRDETRAGGFRCRAAMVTLTYAPEIDWQARHVSAFVKAVRQYLARRGFACRFVWVLELTKAGRPHYHALFWLPRGLTLPKPDRRGWWPHGSTRIEWARSPVGYLCKYASKGCAAGDLPKGARLCGLGGLSVAGRRLRSWRLCPAWVREVFAVEDRPIRAPGGGWLSRLSGDFEPARWRLVARASDWSWLRFEPVGGDAPGGAAA